MFDPARGNFPNDHLWVHMCVPLRGFPCEPDTQGSATECEVMAFLSMTVHSPEWTDTFVRLGFRKEWLEHYGSHFEFERLDKERRFNEMMETLETVDDTEKCYLLQHAHMCGRKFWNISSYGQFMKLLAEHDRVYNRPSAMPTSCGASA